MKRIIKRIIKKGLAKFGYQIQRLPLNNPTPNNLWTPISLWDEDKRFNSLMEQITEHTVVNKEKCFMLYQCAKQVSKLPGDISEVGVYKGGTARLLIKTLEAKNKTTHLFDTFSGEPFPNSGENNHKERDFSNTSLEIVKTYLDDCKDVHFYQGVFPNTSISLENISFCLVHIDVSSYRTVTDCCNFFYPKMERGGIMIFDDYGFLGAPGVRKAVDEFFSAKPETPFYLLTGQSIIIRV